MNIQILLLEYYDQFIRDITKFIELYRNQKIDSYMFNQLAESVLQRYYGRLDGLHDSNSITYKEWKKDYDSATEYVLYWEKIIRKEEFDPKDPQED